jgi:hypothetical protein
MVWINAVYVAYESGLVIGVSLVKFGEIEAVLAKSLARLDENACKRWLTLCAAMLRAKEQYQKDKTSTKYFSYMAKRHKLYFVPVSLILFSPFYIIDYFVVLHLRRR